MNWIGLVGVVMLGCGETNVEIIGTGGTGGTGEPGGYGGGDTQGGTASGGRGGSGGSGGSSVAGSGGKVADSCEESSNGFRYLNESLLAQANTAYEGEAVVERSDAQALLLVYGGDADDPNSRPIRTTLRGGATDSPMPIFPIGSKLWLTREPAEVQQNPGFFTGPVIKWAFTLRNAQAGDVLFGGAIGTQARHSSAAWPLSVNEISSEAVCEYQATCFRTSHYPIEIQADAAALVSTKAPQVVKLNGIDYDVHGSYVANNAIVPGPCSDAFSSFQILLDVRAKQIAPLLENVEMGELPACVQGNATLPEIYIGVAGAEDYSGPVYFQKKRNDDSTGGLDYYVFNTRPDQPLGDSEIQVSVQTSPGLLPDFEFGQELWVDAASWELTALRDSEEGALLAFALNDTPSAELLASAEQHLGVSFEVSEDCAYAFDRNNEVSLSKVEFATVQPTQLRSGELKTLNVDGTELNVALSSVGNVSLAAWPKR